ncbi:MAG: hypothetical protein Fur0035_15800 [Anaerolineales bacterium]
MTRRVKMSLAIGLFILSSLACSLPVSTPTAPPAATADGTKIVLEIQATALAAQMTQLAQAPAATPAPIQVTVEITSLPAPTAQPATAEISPAPSADFDVWMKRDAKILVYEDTQSIGLWIRDALDGMNLKYTHVGDSLGTFMENLNSGIAWDLIIVGAESKTSVQGEFWDVISERVSRKNTALIAEVWYLDLLGEGRIKPLLTGCGVRFQRDWPLADSIYWLQPDQPVFNTPNTSMPLIHYNLYWSAQAGDLIKLAPGSKAILLAGTFQKQKSDYGVLASCYDGRVILQTFSNHDFRRDEIMLLWQNYVYNTLQNRFAALP